MQRSGVRSPCRPPTKTLRFPWALGLLRTLLGLSLSKAFSRDLTLRNYVTITLRSVAWRWLASSSVPRAPALRRSLPPPRLSPIDSHLPPRRPLCSPAVATRPSRPPCKSCAITRSLHRDSNPGFSLERLASDRRSGRLIPACFHCQGGRASTQVALPGKTTYLLITHQMCFILSS